jgi:hypothetical protein
MDNNWIVSIYVLFGSIYVLFGSISFGSRGSSKDKSGNHAFFNSWPFILDAILCDQSTV